MNKRFTTTDDLDALFWRLCKVVKDRSSTTIYPDDAKLLVDIIKSKLKKDFEQWLDDRENVR